MVSPIPEGKTRRRDACPPGKPTHPTTRLSLTFFRSFTFAFEKPAWQHEKGWSLDLRSWGVPRSILERLSQSRSWVDEELRLVAHAHVTNEGEHSLRVVDQVAASARRAAVITLVVLPR